MIFGKLNPEKKFDIKILQNCPPHLSDVATLTWEILKKFLIWLLTSQTHLKYVATLTFNLSSIAYF